jgi:hypothetical protein
MRVPRLRCAPPGMAFHARTQELGPKVIRLKEDGDATKMEYLITLVKAYKPRNFRA